MNDLLSKETATDLGLLRLLTVPAPWLRSHCTFTCHPASTRTTPERLLVYVEHTHGEAIWGAGANPGQMGWGSVAFTFSAHHAPLVKCVRLADRSSVRVCRGGVGSVVWFGAFDENDHSHVLALWSLKFAFTSLAHHSDQWNAIVSISLTGKYRFRTRTKLT